MTRVDEQVCVVRDIAVLRAVRRGDHHSISDLAVEVEVRFDTAAADITGDALQRAVHALAPEFAAGDPEPYALAIAHYCRQRLVGVVAARVQIRTRLWTRLSVGGRPRGRDFTGPATEERLAGVESDANGDRIFAGIGGLIVLSAPETDGAPVLQLRLGARWTYGWPDVPFATQWQQVRRALTEAYAERRETGSALARALAQAVLEEAPPVSRIEVTLEEAARETVDLTSFGMENTGSVFGGPAPARTVHEARLGRSELS